MLVSFLIRYYNVHIGSGVYPSETMKHCPLFQNMIQKSIGLMTFFPQTNSLHSPTFLMTFLVIDYKFVSSTRIFTHFLHFPHFENCLLFSPYIFANKLCRCIL